MTQGAQASLVESASPQYLRRPRPVSQSSTCCREGEHEAWGGGWGVAGQGENRARTEDAV